MSPAELNWTVKTHVPTRDWRWIQIEVSRPAGGTEWWTGEALADTRDRLCALSGEVALRVLEVERALANPIQRWYLPAQSRGTPYVSPDAALAVGARIAALMATFDAALAKHDVAAAAVAAQELIDIRESDWPGAVSEVPKPARRRGDSNDGFL